MKNVISLKTPEKFSFKHTVYSHGWYQLAPFELDEVNWRLTYVFGGRKSSTAVVSEDGKGLKIEITGNVDPEKVVAGISHILRLDEDLEEFYLLACGDIRLEWVRRSNAGRLLRSATVFEDLIKTLCTTNCSWGLTKKMVSNIVEKLGTPTKDGRRAFPAAQAFEGLTEDFFREEIRAGYRSPYFVELSDNILSGDLDPEMWLGSTLTTAELKKEIKGIKGVGDYAAENLLKLLGRYDGLALDSWLRSQYYKKHNREKICPDKKIEKHYKQFGHWKGLAIWCDLTKRWFDEKQMNEQN